MGFIAWQKWKDKERLELIVIDSIQHFMDTVKILFSLFLDFYSWSNEFQFKFATKNFQDCIHKQGKIR